MVEQIAPTAIGADRLDKLMSGKLLGQQPPQKLNEAANHLLGMVMLTLISTRFCHNLLNVISLKCSLNCHN